MKFVFTQLSALADGAVLLPGFGAGGSGYWLDRWSQGTEETSDKGKTKTPPGAKHRPPIAMANVIRKAVQVPWITGKLKVNAGNTGTEGDNAESSCNNRSSTKFDG
ncbi:hypothetical protein AMECASPLE_026094 [Ameca splendens]|uniref:Uncharacterized protein n=1 Tax=Ameca splendens TaxID=208324 RepID=A0ABV0ZQ11_9TELE